MARYGDHDHIAVGHAGVFLLESKNLQGIAEIKDGVLRLRRRLDPDENAPFRRVRPRALAAAAELNDEIEKRCGRRIWVQAVVVLWCDFPQRIVDDGKCVFIEGSELRNWLECRPERLADSEVDAITAAINELADTHAPDPAQDDAADSTRLIPTG